MKRSLFLLVACAFFNVVNAQTNPVLMKINDVAITRSEFEYIYNKNNSLHNVESKDMDQYIDLFVNFKLKVAAAKELGLDTTKTFRDELDGYKRQLAKSYLIDDSANELAAKQYYDKISKTGYSETVQVVHIFKYLPQNITNKQHEAIKQQIDSIYSMLSNSTDLNFNDFVQKYSDDKEPFWVSILQTPEEFESKVFAMKVGDISAPFFTPQGIHIVKLIDTKPLPSFEDIKGDIINRMHHRTGVNKGVASVVDRLKKEYNYQINQQSLNQLLSKGETDDVLFYINQVPYSGQLFKKFANAYPAVVQNQFDAFVTKSFMDYEYARLEEKYPEFRYLMQEYKEGMLLFEISNLEIWENAMLDEEGQKQYFTANKSNYKWNEPKFKGLIVHAKNPKVEKQIKKTIRKKPMDQWKQLLEDKFNTSDESVLAVEEGFYSKGDNKNVDALIYKTGHNEFKTGYPYIFVFGEKEYEPSSYLEVRGELISDYQNHLDALWVNRLRANAKVEINKDVIKTVNNH